MKHNENCINIHFGVWAECDNPGEFALWVWIKSFIQDDPNNVCTVSDEGLAVLSGMSAKAVAWCRQQLMEHKLLQGKFKRLGYTTPGRPIDVPVWHLTAPEPQADYCQETGKPERPGYVYLLKSGPYYKIGASKDISKRMKQLSTLPPFHLELVCAFWQKNMFKAERILHGQFDSKRVRGEWFELNDDDVNYIKKLGEIT